MDEKLKEMLIKRNVPVKYLGSKLTDFDLNINTTDSLFITGPVGCGKTHLAIALIRNDIERSGKGVYHTGLFVSMVNMLAEIKDTYNSKSKYTEKEIIDKYCTALNLYIDDIGVEKVSDWVLNIVYHIIDYRYSMELRTVFTSNVSFDTLHDKLGERIVSRIAGMCELVEMKGVDRRLNK